MPDLTVTLTAAQVTRVQAALLDRDPRTPVGLPEVEEFLKTALKFLVIQYEERVAAEAIVPIDIP